MLRFIQVTLLLLVTGLGVWLASSLVAFAGGPPELACVAGVLLFPVLPLWWEKRATEAFYAQLKRSTRLLPKKRALTPSVRVALRTVFINFVFVVALLALWPKVVFTALATRGDWFLGQRQGPWVDRTRGALLAATSSLEWLHTAARSNPNRSEEDTKAPVPEDVKPSEVTVRSGSGARWRKPDPTPVPREPTPEGDHLIEPFHVPLSELQKLTPPGDHERTTLVRWKTTDGAEHTLAVSLRRLDELLTHRTPEPVPEVPQPTEETPPPAKLTEEPPLAQTPSEDAAFTVGQTSWPWPKQVHPVVAGMTASDETSPESVARYISSRVTDPFERVKALHDWVVTRLRYDFDSISGVRKRQDARSVFDGRLGVCEGYARLLVELGRLTGDRIVYVTGEVREQHGELAPVGHAWNAVQIKGAWYLMDATWDDPTGEDHEDHHEYRTDYLFIPPQVAGFDHFPDEPRWQLRDVLLTRAAFLRQPMTGPGLAREQLALQAPAGPVVDVDDKFTLKLENPRRVFVSVGIGDQTCGPSDAEVVELECDVPAGAKEANVFSNRAQYGTYDFVAGFKLR